MLPVAIKHNQINLQDHARKARCVNIPGVEPKMEPPAGFGAAAAPNIEVVGAACPLFCGAPNVLF